MAPAEARRPAFRGGKGSPGEGAFAPGPGKGILNPAGWSRDPTVWGLLLANLWIIYLYLAEGWPAEMILLVYWSQSVIIGLFTFLRMITLRRFDPDGITSNGVPVPATRRAQRGLAFFFLLHFYGFHLVYLLFIATLFTRETSGPIRFDILLGATGIFFLNHLFSFAYHRWVTRESPPPFGKLMFLPYLRIIPMHLCILVGALTGDFILIGFFTLLKTAADLGGHILEHLSNAPRSALATEDRAG